MCLFHWSIFGCWPASFFLLPPPHAHGVLKPPKYKNRGLNIRFWQNCVWQKLIIFIFSFEIIYALLYLSSENRHPIHRFLEHRAFIEAKKYFSKKRRISRSYRPIFFIFRPIWAFATSSKWNKPPNNPFGCVLKITFLNPSPLYYPYWSIPTYNNWISNSASFPPKQHMGCWYVGTASKGI